jgi:hypothetical protein
MLSKRKALIGYGVYTAAKPLAKRAVRQKVKHVVPRSKKRIAAASAGVAAAVGAAAGGIVFWRKRRSGSAESPGS